MLAGLLHFAVDTIKLFASREDGRESRKEGGKKGRREGGGREGGKVTE